ncbi:MAG: glycosyltransferase family 4 protein [Candidatus Competibacteraceae bacterium]|nr:glycosyltransferase family 4 protein [Candidatus Competibacteraceae bacterium]MBK8896119.1 glycosyltransferase family 4 protein [Candidatus Competibacteraceae bacterium]MBK8964277.1 glycosyltransferase family 4 protein [Candidatus Competibacteraceae bacterium]
MRVAMFSSESLHSICLGGLGVHVTELAAGLCRRGHELHVITRRQEAQSDYQSIGGVHYHRIEHGLSDNEVECMGFMCQAMAHRFERITAMIGSFDIAHAHDWLATDALRSIMDGFDTPGVLTMHSTEYGRAGNVFHDGFARQVRDIEAAGCHDASLVIAVSQFLAEELQRIYRVPMAKVRIVPNGVSYQSFAGACDAAQTKARYGIAPTVPTVFSPGRMTAQKGMDLLVEAIPLILASHPEARFILSGEGPEKAAIARQAQHFGVASATVLLGRLPYRDYIDMLFACDVVAVPSRNEPFGIVVLDAWAAAKPVVVTTAGGPRDFVEHNTNGFLTEVRPDALAQGITALLADREHGRLLGANGRRAVEETFNWDNVAAHTEAVYQLVAR